MLTNDEGAQVALTDFPLVWDATMVRTGRSCPRQLELAYVNGYQPKGGKNVHLHAGGAWAKALERTRKLYYGEGYQAADAEAEGLKTLIEAYGDFECPPEEAKSLDRMIGAFAFYFERYPLDSDPARPIIGHTGPMVEFSFAVPIGVAHPLTGEELVYSGRSDMVAEFAGGNYIFDDKTTKSLGPSWANQWATRSQFIGYTWAARSFGYSIAGSLIRGVSILKTKFDTQQAIVNHPDFLVERWLQQTRRDLERFKAFWLRARDSGEPWDLVLDEACSDYSGCMFKNACLAPDPTPWLSTYFEIRKWDPLGDH